MRSCLADDPLCQRDACAVDQTVDRTEFTHGRLDTLFGRLAVGDIGFEEAGWRSQLRGERGARLLLHVGNHDASAASDYFSRTSGTQTGTAPGDDKGTISHVHGRSFFVDRLCTQKAFLPTSSRVCT